MKTRLLTLALLAACVLAAGCKGGGTTEIRTLLDDPARFDRTTVRIAGTVKSSIGVLGYGAYEVDDGTGTLPVVTSEGGAPREGAKVGVEGEFRSGFTLGAKTAAVVVEKRRYTP
jgi:hypothetical protein